VDEIMTEEVPVSAAQGTLKRMMEAEKRAREILRAAEESGKETLGITEQQAKQKIESVRQEMEDILRSRLKEVESKAAAELKARLCQVDGEAQEIERRAKENLSAAVGTVVSWITNGGE
jgi:DNA anti-recombination protein RmuC